MQYIGLIIDDWCYGIDDPGDLLVMKLDAYKRQVESRLTHERGYCDEVCRTIRNDIRSE